MIGISPLEHDNRVRKFFILGFRVFFEFIFLPRWAYLYISQVCVPLHQSSRSINLCYIQKTMTAREKQEEQTLTPWHNKIEKLEHFTYMHPEIAELKCMA
jgi:hypothetical protein